MMKKTAYILLPLTTLLLAACIDKNVYDESQSNGSEQETANTFDFATTRSITLNVDYSAYDTHGPVFFSVYSENPFEGEGEAMVLKEDVAPIYENYTDAKGLFSQKVTLPAYARELYIVNGNFFVMESMMAAEVQDNTATAVATNYAESSAARAMRTMRRVGTPTNSLETLYQLSYEVDVNTADKRDKQIYKEWATPLGTWDSESGRPNYLLEKTAANAELLFTDEELEGLYQAVSEALTANKTCNKSYRTRADLMLEKDSEVSITFLGGTTCWNNTVGYYYYTEDTKPTNPMDLNIIMLFPNTQEGRWSRDWMPVPDFYGNIALERGDAVKMKYYPHIANGDLSEASDIFPKGTYIGFILKPNGWGMQKCNGDKKYYNSYKGEGDLKKKTSTIARQYNVWASSTNGLSYCNPEQIANDKGAIALPNPDGESRSAKFAYKENDNLQYAIVSFEDACNDLDFDDVVFALKPNALANLPTIEHNKSVTTSVYAYEDLWPSKGDYDMNDVMVELKQQKEFEMRSSDKEYKIYKETFALTTYQNYVELTSGLALKLELRSNPLSIVMKKVNPETADTTVVNFTKESKGNVYLLTDDVKGELNTTYIIEINYKSGITNDSKTALAYPFIYRNNENDDMRWEVHIPYEAPTTKMDFSYFGLDDDCSVPAEGKFFVRSGSYPFAFCLSGVTINNFRNTLLNRDNEKKRISDLYPRFLGWSTSNGEENADWYLHPRE